MEKLTEKELLPVKSNGSDPSQLLVLALEKGTSVEQLEKLMDLQDRFLARQAKSAYQQALSDFQNACPKISKTAKGHTSKYARIEDIDEVIKPLLARFGLTKNWKYKQGAGQITVECYITHIGGHSEFSEMTAQADTSGNKSAIHAMASTISYLERYTLKGALGITTAGEDNDGRSNKSGGTDLVDLREESEANSKEFAKILKKFMGSDKAKIEDVQKFYLLSDSQTKSLQLAQDARKK